LSAVPPGAAGDPVLRWHGDQIASLQPKLTWSGYLSTVGVYGDHDGGWIDEETPVAPVGIRGHRRVEAERLWQEKTGGQVHVFRLPGIYGPGRNALEQLRAGRARLLVKKGQVFNRIHVDDLVQVLIASMNRPGPAPGATNRIYNVCDDLPAPPQDVIVHAAALLGMEPPPELDFETAELSSMARSFYGECKRVRNHRIKTGLGVKLAFPTYREGLQAIFQLHTGPESVS
jgi:nucleoside-diphosphate-sugar epimerase